MNENVCEYLFFQKIHVWLTIKFNHAIKKLLKKKSYSSLFITIQEIKSKSL